MGGSKYPKIPQIRLSNTDMKQAPEGEYFIEIYKGKDEEPEIKILGPNPEIVILYKTSTYSYYTKEHGLVAWTSDIHGFSALDRVTLFVKRDGKVVIEKDAVYPEFKQYIQAKYTTVDPVTGDSKKLSKIQDRPLCPLRRTTAQDVRLERLLRRRLGRQPELRRSAASFAPGVS